MRFLGIHPVQSVVNSPTQLSGRGFARIFHMKLVLSQLYVFWCSKMEVGYCNLSKTDFSKRELTPLDPSRKMRSEIPLFLAYKTYIKCAIWNSSRSPRMPRMKVKWCQDPRLGPPIPHAPGARMTWVKQTPSNKRYGEILFQKVASGYLLHFVQDGSSKSALKK